MIAHSRIIETALQLTQLYMFHLYHTIRMIDVMFMKKWRRFFPDKGELLRMPMNIISIIGKRGTPCEIVAPLSRAL